MGVRSSSVRKEVRDGKTRLVIDFRYRGKDGRMHRFRRDASVQTATAARAEAERLRTRAITEGTLEIQEAPVVPTFAEFVRTTFTEVYVPSKCRPATRERYSALFGQGILDAFGTKRLDAIGAADFRIYGAALVARRVQSRPHLSLARTVLRAAVELGVLAKLPELPRLPKASKKLPDAPSEEEVLAMLTHAKGWLRLAIALSAFAGLRMGEVRALEVRDVQLKQGCILVRRALSATEVMPPKSGNERIVPLVPSLRALLEEAIRGKQAKDRIVLNAKGRTPSRQHVLTRFKAFEQRHGLRDWSFHALRHAFCTTLIRQGANVEAVRLLAGHSDLKVTQRYVHATAADLAAAMAKLVGNVGN